MNPSPQELLFNMRLVSKSLYDGAKFWWGSGLLLKVIAAGLGVTFVFVNQSSALTSASVVCAAIFSELCQWRSDVLKGRAEALKRKIESADGFGWNLSGKDISDSLAKISARTRAKIEEAVKENYFASQEQPGVRRALENLQESSWWSKDLSGTMAIICAIITAVLFTAALGALVVSVGNATDVAVLQTVNRVVISIIALVTSVGLLKLIVGYFSFSRKAEQIEQATSILLLGDPSDIEAVKVLHEYQVARASAPLVPDFIWKLRQDTLNDLWKRYRCQTVDPAN